MNFSVISETYAKGSGYTFMVVPIILAIVGVVFACIITNLLKVLMARKWVAPINIESSESISGDKEEIQMTEVDEEDEELKRIAKMYDDI